MNKNNARNIQRNRWDDYIPTAFTQPPMSVSDVEDMVHGQEWFPINEGYSIHRTNIVKAHGSGVFALWDRENKLPVGYIGVSVIPPEANAPWQLLPCFNNNPFATLNFDLSNEYARELNVYEKHKDNPSNWFSDRQASEFWVWLMEFDQGFLDDFKELSDKECDGRITLRDIFMGIYSLIVSDFAFVWPGCPHERWNNIAYIRLRHKRQEGVIQLNPNFKQPTAAVLESIGLSNFIFPCITSLEEDLYFVSGMDMKHQTDMVFGRRLIDVYDKEMDIVARIGGVYINGHGSAVEHAPFHDEYFCSHLPTYMNADMRRELQCLEESMCEDEGDCFAIWSLKVADRYEGDVEVLCDRIAQAIREKLYPSISYVKIITDEAGEYFVKRIPEERKIGGKMGPTFSEYVPEDESVRLLDSVTDVIPKIEDGEEKGFFAANQRFDLSSGDVYVWEVYYCDNETEDGTLVGMFSIYNGVSDGLFPQYVDFKGRIDFEYIENISNLIAHDPKFVEPCNLTLLWMVQVLDESKDTADAIKAFIEHAVDGDPDLICTKSPCLYLFNNSITPEGFVSKSPADFLGERLAGDMGSANEFQMDTTIFNEEECECEDDGLHCACCGASLCSDLEKTMPDCRNFSRLGISTPRGTNIVIENAPHHLKAKHSAVVKFSANNQVLGYFGVSALKKGSVNETPADWVTSEDFDPMVNEEFIRAYSNAIAGAKDCAYEGVGLIWHAELNPAFSEDPAVKNEIAPALFSLIATFMNEEVPDIHFAANKGLTGFQFKEGFHECPAGEVMEYLSNR